MKIERVYITGHRHDVRFTQCCVASIRRWYPEIPITLLKDESQSSYDTRELEEAWDVGSLQSELAHGWATLEPMFLPGRRRSLILDSDVVFVGPVLESLDALDADFVVESRGGHPALITRDYFDLVALERLDPEFVFPGYTFNCGQIVATSGILRRRDFEPLVRFGEIPERIRPDVFGPGEQGVLNYVLLKKAQQGELTLERLPFMEWGPSLPLRMARTRTLTARSRSPYLVHWAGWKGKIFRLLRNGRLLLHFERYYYSRVPGGRRKRLWRSMLLPWEIVTGRDTFHTKPRPRRSDLAFLRVAGTPKTEAVPRRAVAWLHPDLSARRVLSPPQAAFLVLLLAALAYLIATAAATTLVVLPVSWLAFCAVTATHELIVSAVALRSPIPASAIEPLDESKLPRYTILVPLYREATVAAGLISAIDRLDYPKHLLDVKLLVEADDAETIEALYAAEPGSCFELLRVTDGHPRTKPRACNFGLSHARGDFVVIFDAEDRPEPDQLKRAVSAFLDAPADVACFQARLGFWNRTTNLLTRYCTAKYCAIFDLLRPGLERLGAPIPLGGTSNHFPVRLLRELGAWDEFNVAEDADLGIRIARAGYRTRSLDSTTYEEANSHLGNWIRQQSRWIKGYLQTWLVHIRHPVRLSRQLGPRASIQFHLTMLSPVVPVLLAPFGWALAVVWLLTILRVVNGFLPFWLLSAFAASFVLRTTAETCILVAGLRRRGYRDLVPYSVLFPAFELVKSVAAAKAVAQLVTRPSYWEKTVHGLDRERSVASSTLPLASVGDSGRGRKRAGPE